MKKTLSIVGIVAIIVFGVFATSNIAKKPKNNPQKITIITTLFPLYDFAKNIGQHKAKISLLLGPGAEAHVFEPKPSDIIKINESDLFIYTGKFMEPWTENIIKEMKDKNKVVDASRGIELMKNDPHIWLDFENAKIMVDNIAKALVEKDPVNAFYYQNNAQKYNEKLTKLDNDYKTTLANCQSKEIIHGGHYTFGYLAKRYGLNYRAAQGFSPDSEPTANDLIKLVEQIKNNNVKYIFYEEMTSPKIAETLSKETDVRMLLLNGAHNLSKKDYKNNATYISLMKNNLKNLSFGLFCAK